MTPHPKERSETHPVTSGAKTRKPCNLSHSRLGVLALAALALFHPSTSPPTALAFSVPLPLKAADLIGAWIGMTSTQDRSYRLSLKPKGAGMLAYCYQTNGAHLYQVNKWTIKGRSVEIEATPAEHQLEKVSFRAELEPRGLRLHVRAARWKDEILLQDERQLEIVIGLLRQGK